MSHWKQPKSCRAFTGYVRGSASDPSGTVLHCIANTPIPCNLKEHEKNGKGHVNLTIVGIKNVGWAYAPWKKPKANVKSVRDPSAKCLFEQGEMADLGINRAMLDVKMYSFHREGTFDKGPREDESYSVLKVGQTLHFKIHDFMYEDKSKGESIFPKNIGLIPEFSVVELVVNAGDLKCCTEGWGLKIAKITQCPFTLHSYLHGLGLEKLPDCYAIAEKLAAETPCLTIRNMVEQKNLNFFSSVSTTSFLVQTEPGWYRLVGDEDTPCIPTVQEIDIKQEDLLRFTNAGDDLGYANFIVDLAAAAGALKIYVTYNEFYHKQKVGALPFRGVPLIDTEVLLGFITAAECYDLPFVFEGLKSPFVNVEDKEVVKEDGLEKMCPDFALSSKDINNAKGYSLIYGDEEMECVCEVIYSPPQSTCAGKHVSSGRVDYRTIKTMRV